MNARLTPQIRHLIEALSRVLAEESIDAPLMIVKGDGSLMKAEVALEYPVETILSGPAASVVGAGFLTGLEDFVVSDMGGTTTDIAVVSGGRPVIRAEGALVGAWRTMVEAVDVRTSGLGGDSEVHFDRQMRLRVGPRKAMPLSLLAQRFPAVAGGTALASPNSSGCPITPRNSPFRNPDRAAPAAPVAAGAPRVGGARISSRSDVSTRGAQRLRARGTAPAGRCGPGDLAAFTPSDAMHVLGAAAGLVPRGRRVRRAHPRDRRAQRRGAGEARYRREAICERTYEHVVRETGRVLLAARARQRPGHRGTAPTAGACSATG